jgi:[ribosomal protein S5]-alanine N-acetyltransferase
MLGEPDVDLHTSRLHLRALSSSDERLYCGLYTDPHVMRHVAAPLSPEAAKRAFSAVLEQLAADPPKARYWVLGSHEGLGDLGLMAWVPDPGDAGSAEVGVVLAAPAACRGYAAEAIAALANAVFSWPAARRLWTRHARENGPAVGLMRKLGFLPLVADGPSSELRWHLERDAWLDRCAPAFASHPGNC